jgi:predicted amidophosphoribosyltransferase
LGGWDQQIQGFAQLAKVKYLVVFFNEFLPIILSFKEYKFQSQTDVNQPLTSDLAERFSCNRNITPVTNMGFALLCF